MATPRSSRAIAPRSHPIRRLFRLGLLVAVLLWTTFAINGLWCAYGIVPLRGEEPEIPAGATAGASVKVLAWNLNKCGVHRGGLVFAQPADVEARIARVAAVVRAEDPDFVVLTEIVKECTFCNVDQVRGLAKATGMRYWLFGENYNFGLPFLRLVGGNAILAKRPLTAIGNPDLVGRQPFWVTTNNRRALFGAAEIGGKQVVIGAMHLDSFDPGNNLRQVAQVIGFRPDDALMLAGDFNAEPESASMKLLAGSDRFRGVLQGPMTYPAHAPDQRVDYVFGPKDWTVIESRVLDDQSSDHRAVVTTFEVKPRDH